MKTQSETSSLERLRKLKFRFRGFISENYEHNAKSCATCETRGACCLDAHFVNVRISRLEAVAIKNALESLTHEHREAVYERIDDSIGRFGLDKANVLAEKTFACPLFEKEKGCLVHQNGKPATCIHHACYERREDMPPDDLLDEQELAIERLNLRTYGKSEAWLPLPLAIKKHAV